MSSTWAEPGRQPFVEVAGFAQDLRDVDLRSLERIGHGAVEHELPLIYLRPGEAHLSAEPAILKTILGSCVGATFWSQRLGIGALCHGILPRCPGSVALDEGYRYVDFAIRDLARRFDEIGVTRNEVQVQVFGGAGIVPHDAAVPRMFHVGEANCKTALEVLEEEDFNVIAFDLGGRAGRTIQFHTWNGQVLMRRHS